MDIRKLLAGTAVATTLLMGGVLPASADIISDIVNSSGGGDINIKFQNWENFTSPTIAPGTQNFGVFEITSVNAATGPQLWSSGQGGFLVGIFNGITVSSVTPDPALGGFVTQNTGGTFNIYQVPTLPNFSQVTAGYTAGGCAIGGLCYHGISDAGGTMILSFNLAAGAGHADLTSTLQASISGQTVPLTGTASGFGRVTGGTDAPAFITGGFLTAALTSADLEFQDDFCGSGPGCITLGWNESSQDPVKATLAAPEPGSMALLGSALLSLGFLGYRRSKHPRA